jgi:predicted flavoprotein YhiN
MAEAEVQVQTHSVVRSLEPLGLEKGFQVKTSGETYTSKRVILATGGLARPETGSTGDGLNWLRKLGLKVHAPDPSLVPITIKEKKFGALMGVSFLDCGIRVLRGGNGSLENGANCSSPILAYQALSSSTSVECCTRKRKKGQ